MRLNHCMEIMDETDLIKRIVEGDAIAFTALVKRYQRPVFSLMRQIVGSREDAEELTQDVFVIAFTKLHTFRGSSRFSTWLYRVAYNTAISAVRKKKVHYPVVDEKALSNIPDQTVDELLDRADDEAIVLKIECAVEMLKPDEKALISLYYNEGKAINEIASVVSLTAENVKVKLFRIRKKIVFLMNSMTYEQR